MVDMIGISRDDIIILYEMIVMYEYYIWDDSNDGDSDGNDTDDIIMKYIYGWSLIMIVF